MPKQKCKCRQCRKRRVNKHSKCDTCRSRNYSKKYPVRKIFYDLRKSAKRRSYEFTITIPYLDKLIQESGYLHKRGRGKNNLTFDRIKNEQGYIEGNIRVVSKSVNSKKRDKPLTWGKPDGYDDVPF